MSERMHSESTGAADFLGLSEELAQPQAADADAPLTNAWLFEMEAEAPIAPAPASVPAPAAFDVAPAAAVLTAIESRPSGNRKALALVVLATLVMAGGALLVLPFGKQATQPLTPLATPVASLAKPQIKAETSVPIAITPAVSSTQDSLAEVVSAPENTPALPTTAGESTVALVSETTPGGAAVSASNEAGAPVPVIALPVQDTGSSAPSAILQLAPGIRRATAADYAGLYMGESLPNVEIQGTQRLSTPQVGLVRAELLSGDSYQGQLHSVGLGCIWIELELGRMRIESSELKSLDKVATTAKQSEWERSIAGLQQVRVRTPGGAIDGWLVSRSGDKVTLVTATAQRLVLESRDVEPLSGVRSRLVGRLAP